MQLSEKTIRLIKDSQQLINTHGESITCHMYVLLFSRYPETTQLFSDMGKQPKKLAQAIAAFVAHIEVLDQLQPALEKVSEHHVRAGVEHKHYAMVARVLMDAMQEILGEAVFTAELKTAWQQAYDVLAAHLIQQEQRVRVVQ